MRFEMLSSRAALLGILLFAVLARVLRLGISIIVDEPFSINAASRSWQQMNAIVVSDLVHPPLHYYVLHIWFQLFGAGIQRARWISVIFGVAAVLLVYQLGRYLFDRATGLIAALLFGLAPFPAIYAQIARPYSMHLFLSLCASYLFIRAIREHRDLYWWESIACLGLALYTLYYGLFVLLTLTAFLILFRYPHQLRRSWLLGGGLALVLAYVPWLSYAIIPRLMSPKGIPGRMASNPIHWHTPVTIVNLFNSSPQDHPPLWSFAVGALLFTLPAILTLWPHLGGALHRTNSSSSVHRENLLFLLMLSALPVFAVLSLGLLHVRFEPRYVLMSAPYYFVLVAWGVRKLTGSAMQAGPLTAIVAYSAYALVDRSYLNPGVEDVRDALAFVSKAYESEDCAIFHHGMMTQWINDHGSPPFRVIDIQDVRAERADLSGCGRTWLLLFTGSAQPDIVTRVGEHAALVGNQHFYKVNMLLYQSAAQRSSDLHE